MDRLGRTAAFEFLAPSADRRKTNPRVKIAMHNMQFLRAAPMHVKKSSDVPKRLNEMTPGLAYGKKPTKIHEIYFTGNKRMFNIS